MASRIDQLGPKLSMAYAHMGWNPIYYWLAHRFNRLQDHNGFALFIWGPLYLWLSHRCHGAHLIVGCRISTLEFSCPLARKPYLEHIITVAAQKSFGLHVVNGFAWSKWAPLFPKAHALIPWASLSCWLRIPPVGSSLPMARSDS